MTARKMLVVAVSLTATVALAALSPLLITASISSGELSVATNRLPKGWFSSQNSFDRTRSTLSMAWSFGATSCSYAALGGSLSSESHGTFQPALGPNGQVVGYYWDGAADVSANANHWYNHHLCDGTVQVVGCPAAIPVTVTVTAYGKNGCHTYVNDSGQTVCASDTRVVSLASVQDADVIDECEVDCGIGYCVSACEYRCQRLSDKRARQECQRSCPCDCKLQLPASCPPHLECL